MVMKNKTLFVLHNILIMILKLSPLCGFLYFYSLFNFQMISHSVLKHICGWKWMVLAGGSRPYQKQFERLFSLINHNN